MNKIAALLVFTLIYLPLNAIEKVYTVKSPNGQLEVTVVVGERLTYQVKRNGTVLIDKSEIGLQFEDREFGKNANVAKSKIRAATECIDAPNYRIPSFSVTYNELDISFKEQFGLHFRAYDEGVAYRFYTSSTKPFLVQNEIAEFSLAGDCATYMAYSTAKDGNDPYAMAFQNIYTKAPLTAVNADKPAFLPVTIDYGSGLKLTILESDLESYPGMFIRGDGKNLKLKGEFARFPSRMDRRPWRYMTYVAERSCYIAKVDKARTLPWRILAVSEKDINMPHNNLVYALASPNRIGDCSWVQPGKSAWEWWNNWGVYGVNFKTGINTETYKHYIDFASRYGLEYVILDEGWYNPASGDMMKVIPEIDLPELVTYAKSKGVGIILWTVFNVLDAQLHEACKYYSKLGVKGFKVDFLDRDDQDAVEMVYRIAEVAAKYKLVLNYHGLYKPTGLNRTYPNVLNFEAVFGTEEVKWSTVEKDIPQYDVTFSFIRMMAGSVDYTPGAMHNAAKKDFVPIYNNPMSQGTRCHQLATYIVYDSPLTMLCDSPTLYYKEPTYTKFLSSLPVVFDEARVISGELGEYIVTARRKGSRWYVGGLTNWTARELQVDLSFLDKNKSYTIVLYKDGVNAEKQASDYACEELLLDGNPQLNVHLASGGGFVAYIEETIGNDLKVTTPPTDLGLFTFYKKYVDASGIPIVSSEKVRDEALLRARKVIIQMLSKHKPMRDMMIAKGCKVMIIGEKEEVCELPEYAHICNTPESIAYWNKRARGFGGSPEDDFSASCGEENVLCLPCDRYVGESILVHEFAHIIHMIGIVGIDPSFNDRLESLRLSAIEKGLWKDTYCISNKEEYFAETVQSFFNCNRFSLHPNGVHNAINTREKLKLYDPDMYNLLLEYFDEIDLDLCEDNRSK